MSTTLSPSQAGTLNPSQPIVHKMSKSVVQGHSWCATIRWSKVVALFFLVLGTALILTGVGAAAGALSLLVAGKVIFLTTFAGPLIAGIGAIAATILGFLGAILGIVIMGCTIYAIKQLHFQTESSPKASITLKTAISS